MNKLSNIIDKDSNGLYRDYGLGIFESLSGAQIERRKKNIIKVFKESVLLIIVTTNIISVDFLDVAFKLKTAWYQSFRKPNKNLNTLTSTLIIPHRSWSNFQSQSRKDYPKYRHLRKYLIIQNPMKKLYKRATYKKSYVTNNRMWMLTPIRTRKKASVK